ncbi:MAG: T9SS type A sorting domain-containing protein [Ignavibacteriae bacterium]|nr:T9SS type A sorting domain-containing protein [Ignavibacteriota bacterium]
MKSKILLSVLVFITIIFAFGFSGDRTETMTVNNVVFKFEATNGNGNNIWLDNFSVGARYDNDLTISSFSLRDRNYLIPGVSSTSVSPIVTIFNIGRIASSGATVTLTDQGAYTSTKSIGSVTSGYTANITFDPVTFNLNTSKNLKVYITWATDQNHGNDTLSQATVFLAGVQKKILFEAHTSTTCGPCASQNPALDAFIQSHFDSCIAIKYHVWWPALGDPMYALNIPQARVRTQYNSVSAVPCLMVDGVLQQVSGYTTLSNLLNPFNARRALGSPIGISVVDTRLPGDTIKATITINVVAAPPSNVDYRLRINAIERKITYSSPPGSNGETIFYDVFRRAYPSSDGIPINYSTPGTYTVEYKYKRESAWIDSMMYTTVFIQDEFNHEVINCARGRNYYADEKIIQPVVTDNSVEPKFSTVSGEYPLLIGNGLQVETMETPVPPPGWSIINADSNFTFWQYIYSAVNGPTFPGSRSIRINYYSYTENIGTIDALKTKVFNNINPTDTIKFDYAYAPRTGYTDRLVLKVSTNGGATFPYTVFDKSGTNLATAPATTSSFVPTAGQWGTFAISYAMATSVNPQGTFTPLVYELSQNYPNPFNPVTSIRYQIAKSGFVILKVYDVLGKEITTLVNEEMNAGSHDVTFDASNIPSGVYFYKITSDAYTETRKMLLIK